MPFILYTRVLVLNLFALLLAHLSAPHAHAQCNPQWQPFDPTTASFPGTNGQVHATTLWDPDGSGPQTPKLVLGGDFTIAGDIFANRIATFDPATGEWATLGTGMTGAGANVVSSLAVLSNGDLVAGGSFTNAGGIAASRVARWSTETAQWTPLGAGMNDTVHALTPLPNGDLIAGGVFTTAGGVNASRIARWIPATGQWTPLGFGVDDGFSASRRVYAIAVLPNGDLIVGGDFTRAGTVPANRIARWSFDNQQWTPLGSGVSGSTFTDPAVKVLLTLPDGHLVVAGTFTSAGGIAANAVARWNPATGQWAPLATGLRAFSSDASANALAILPDGQLVVAGVFSAAGGVLASNIARWNPMTGIWAPLGTGITSAVSVHSLTMLPNGDLVAAGFLFAAGSVQANYLARWKPATDEWTSLALGLAGPLTALTTLANGDLIAGGIFSVAGGVAANNIARWSHITQQWAPLASGIDRSPSTFAVLPSGDLIVAGSFTTAGAVSANNIALWNPTTGLWARLGAGLTNGTENASVHALAILPNGDVIVGGTFSRAGDIPANNVARWNPVTARWTPLGTGITNGASSASVSAITTLASGTLVFTGTFTSAGGAAARNIALWNPATGQWAPLGAGLSNGSAWTNGTALATLSSGDLVAAGSFTTAGGVAVNNIASWNPTTGQWARLGTGLSNASSVTFVSALSVLPSGDLIAAGSFNTAGGIPVGNIARWISATSQWTPIGVGMNAPVVAIAMLPNSDLVAGGSFTTADSIVTPSIARWGCRAPACDSIDFNNDGLFPEDQDLIDFLSILAGGLCSPGNTCNDIDFNNDTLFPSDDDLIAFLRVLVGSPCY